MEQSKIIETAPEMLEFLVNLECTLRSYAKNISDYMEGQDELLDDCLSFIEGQADDIRAFIERRDLKEVRA